MHSSGNGSVSSMWPEGKISVTEVTKRPATAGTIFKNSMIALTQNLASKVKNALNKLRDAHITAANIDMNHFSLIIKSDHSINYRSRIIFAVLNQTRSNPPQVLTQLESNIRQVNEWTR